MAGVEIYAYSLSKELLDKNQVSVFYRVTNLREREYKLSRGIYEGLDTFTVNNTFKDCESFEKFYKDSAITRKFIDVLDTVNPDIVHIQHLIFLSTDIIAEAKKRGIPIIFTLHDYWLICPQWHFLKKSLDLCKNSNIAQCVHCLDYQLSIKNIPKRAYLAFRGIIPGFLILFLRGAYLSLVRTSLNSEVAIEKIKARIEHIKKMCQEVDVFIAPSHFLLTKFIRFGIPENRIRLISYGLDTRRTNELQRKKSQKIRFAFIGTIIPAKGPDILIKAFNMIGRDKPAELKIYGKVFPYRGFEYYPGFIKRLVKARNKNIKLMGGVDNKDIAKVFSEIDILVVPSIWYENAPLVILESFMMNTPVIASNIGGIPELVHTGRNGLLFEPRDPIDLYEKMMAFVNNPILIEEFRKNINPPKDVKENARELEKLYNDLLNSKNASY